MAWPGGQPALALQDLPSEVWVDIAEIFSRRYGCWNSLLYMTWTCREASETLAPVLLRFLAKKRVMKIFMADHEMFWLTRGSMREMKLSTMVKLKEHGLRYRLYSVLRREACLKQTAPRTDIVCGAVELLDVHDDCDDFDETMKWLSRPDVRFAATEIHWCLNLRSGLRCKPSTSLKDAVREYTRLLAAKATACRVFSLRVHAAPLDWGSTVHTGFEYHIPRCTNALRLMPDDVSTEDPPVLVRNGRRVLRVPGLTRGGFSGLRMESQPR